MAHDPGLFDWVAEAMAPDGTVTLRRMMGAATLYCDGLVFAVIDEDRLWLKGDAESAAEWDGAGSERFGFTGKDGVVQTMNYWSAPDDCYDDADALRYWAGSALSASRRAAAKKPRRSPPAGA